MSPPLNGAYSNEFDARTYNECKREPCPACEHRGWCGVADDGSVAMCRRKAQGAVYSGVDRSGVAYYIHRLIPEPEKEDWTPPRPRKAPSGPPIEIADVETRNDVYRSLLGLLALSSHHREDLEIRGFSADVIDQNEYRSLPSGRANLRGIIGHLEKDFGTDALRRVPGFFVNNQDVAGLCVLPGLLLPVRDIRGRIQALVVRPDKRLDGIGKYLWVSSKSRGGPSSGSPCHVPLHSDLGGVHPTVRVTEGVLKSDSATARTGVLTLGSAGVAGWKSAEPVLHRVGCERVLLAFDIDGFTNPVVALHTRECCRALTKTGLTVDVETWDFKHGKGIDDVLAAGKPIQTLSGDQVADYLQTLAGSTPPQGTVPAGVSCPTGSRPTIVIEQINPGDSLGKWTGMVMDALRVSNVPPHLYQKGDQLVRMRQADADGPSAIEALTLDGLRGVLDRSADFGESRVSKGGVVSTRWGPVRMELVRDVASLNGWDPAIIPHIEGVITAPVFLADGRLVTEPGYCPDGHVFYAPSAELEGLTIPKSPSLSQVTAAKSLLFDDVLVDFPFSDEASRANALACMLLPLVREMIDGPTPLHHIQASTPGTGKGLLAKVMAYPFLGRVLSSTPQKESEGEWRKSITSALMSGSPYLFVDNVYPPVRWTRDGEVSTPIDSASLASVLTEKVWHDRLLGGNKEVQVRIKAIFISSGNNSEFSRELNRRISPIFLSALLEKPWERSGFKHPEILTWIALHRRELLTACLTLCQAWIAKGCPPGRQVFGSYESYARTLGGILDVIGVEGFLGNQFKPVEGDRESQRWPALVEAWVANHEHRLVSVGDLWTLITTSEELHEVFADTLGDGKVLSQKQRLGNALRTQNDRVWGGQRIARSEARTGAKSALYRLQPVNKESQGVSGVSGVSKTPRGRESQNGHFSSEEKTPYDGAQTNPRNPGNPVPAGSDLERGEI